MKKYSIRTATVDDFMEFYGTVPPHASRAWVADYKGSTACIVGVEFQPDGAVVFSDIKEGLDVAKITIWRAVLEFSEKLKSLNKPLNAVCTGEFMNSPKMLEMLGFELVHAEEKGIIYLWRP